MNEIIKHVRFWFAKRKADQLTKLYGYRHYVLPRSKGGYMVLNSRDIDRHNRRNSKRMKLTIDERLKLSLYHTK